MDCRVKPGNDSVVPIPAGLHVRGIAISYWGCSL
jgi:hypothetical protein